jgi:Fuc2NAc and GlcNAc transferase
MKLLLLIVGCTVLTYSLAHLYRIIALAFHIVDVPNHRSAHKDHTPTGAGISFVLVFFVGFFLVFETQPTSEQMQIMYKVLPALVLISVIGFVDDYRPLPWALRAIVQVLACTFVIWITGIPILNILGYQVDLGWIGLSLGVVGLVWLLNLYNFMDGIDGIAGGEAVCVLLFGTAIAWYLGSANISESALVLLLCCSGFLIINWPKARAFMGDGGSGFLGLFFGVLVITETMLSLWSWLILLGWFTTDASLTILLRLQRGEKIHEAHNQHAYQNLNRKLGTTRTLLVVFACNTLWLLPLSSLATIAQDWASLLLILAYLPLLVIQYYCGAGTTTPRIVLRKSV